MLRTWKRLFSESINPSNRKTGSAVHMKCSVFHFLTNRATRIVDMNIFPAENQGTQQQRQHSRIYSGFPQSTVARNSRSRRTCLLDEKNKILPIIDSEESEKLLNSLRNIVDEKQQIDNELNVTRETIVKMQNTVMGSNNVLWLLPTIDIAKRDQCIKELSQKTKQRNQEN